MTMDKKYKNKMFGRARGENLKELASEALRRAHDIRKFEIELYWKRAIYFWGFQAAIFAAFAVLFTQENSLPINIFPSLMAFVGFVLATAWVYINKGSKAWQKNWEAHIDFLEDDFTGKLYKTIIGNKEEFYSVSKINEYVSWFIASVWGIIFLVLPFHSCFCGEGLVFFMISFCFLLFFVLIFSCFKKCLRTSFENMKIKEKNEELPDSDEDVEIFHRKISVSN